MIFYVSKYLIPGCNSECCEAQAGTETHTPGSSMYGSRSQTKQYSTGDNPFFVLVLMSRAIDTLGLIFLFPLVATVLKSSFQGQRKVWTGRDRVADWLQRQYVHMPTKKQNEKCGMKEKGCRDTIPMTKGEECGQVGVGARYKNLQESDAEKTSMQNRTPNTIQRSSGPPLNENPVLHHSKVREMPRPKQNPNAKRIPLASCTIPMYFHDGFMLPFTPS